MQKGKKKIATRGRHFCRRSRNQLTSFKSRQTWSSCNRTWVKVGSEGKSKHSVAGIRGGG